MSFQLPLLYPGFDRQRARPARTNDLEAEEYVDPMEGKDFAGHGKGGTNYWVNDNRPTKQEARDRIDDYREARDIGELFQLDDGPWFIVVPFYAAPYLAEVLIEIDPLDRIQD